MRVMMKVSIPVEAGNRAIADGSLMKTMQTILEELKPEAAYFSDSDGMRTGYIFLQIKDSSDIPRIAEPFFLSFNAGVEIHPAMAAQDLAAAGASIEQAVKKYGKR